MKNIVMRRNRKPLDAYFRLVNYSDKRVNFIDKTDDMLLKLHLICLDPQIYAKDYVNDYRVIELNEMTVSVKLSEYCRMFIADTNKKDENQLNTAYFFKNIYQISGILIKL